MWAEKICQWMDDFHDSIGNCQESIYIGLPKIVAFTILLPITIPFYFTMHCISKIQTKGESDGNDVE